MATAPGRRSACLVTNCCNNSAILRLLCRQGENHVGARQLFLVGRDVQDTRSIADSNITRQLLRYSLVASDQVWAIRLVVLEWYQPVVSNEREQAIAVASGHVNPFRRAGIFSQQRSARRDKKVIVAGACDHARATTCPRPGGVQEVRDDNINPGLGQMTDSGSDQRRRVRNAPEAVRQRADLQVAEITIVLHLLTRHDYPSDVLFRALSTHPESSVAGISRRINDVQSRGVRPYR